MARNEQHYVDLDDMDLANIDSIKEVRGLAAISDAIRYSLNVTGRICRREMLEDKMELEALRRTMEEYDGQS